MKWFLGAAIAMTITVASAETCVELKGKYDSAPPPKAFAQCEECSACGYATGRSSKSLAEAKSKALDFCKSSGGKNCKIVLFGVK